MKQQWKVEWTEHRRAFVDAESWDEAVDKASNLDDSETECLVMDYWEAEPTGVAQIEDGDRIITLYENLQGEIEIMTTIKADIKKEDKDAKA